MVSIDPGFVGEIKRAAFEASETPVATPAVVPNVARPRLEVQDMEVETETSPAPVGAGSDQVVPAMDTEGSGMKREAEQSVQDLEDEMAAERASGAQRRSHSEAALTSGQFADTATGTWLWNPRRYNWMSTPFVFMGTPSCGMVAKQVRCETRSYCL